MEIKNKHVAIACDKDGKCEFVAKVKVVDDRELHRLTNEYNLSKVKKEQKENELKQNLLANQEKISRLERRDLLLAKAIYDNYVDSGLISNDANFQREFYNFIFNGGNLEIEKAPTDFQIILRKVGNL